MGLERFVTTAYITGTNEGLFPVMELLPVALTRYAQIQAIFSSEISRLSTHISRHVNSFCALKIGRNEIGANIQQQNNL